LIEQFYFFFVIILVSWGFTKSVYFGFGIIVLSLMVYSKVKEISNDSTISVKREQKYPLKENDIYPFKKEIKSQPKEENIRYERIENNRNKRLNLLCRWVSQIGRLVTENEIIDEAMTRWEDCTYQEALEYAKKNKNEAS
jgi:hypothetical protein